MKRKIDIWNRSLPTASEESQEYARRRRLSPEGDRKNLEPIRKEARKNLPPPPEIPTPDSTTPSPLISPTIHDGEELVDLSEIDLPDRVSRYKGLKQKQIRRRNLSISVSEEEYDLLRKGAVRAGMGFSAWARQVLFNSLRRKVPKRPTN